MSSESAKAVAREVSETIRKDGRVNLGKIIAKRYAKSTSLKPKLVTETKSYKEELKPLIEQLEEERQAVIKDMIGKRSKAKYRDLTDALDKITKNIQLLGGKPTEQTEVKITGINYILPNGNNTNTNPETA